AAGSTGQWPRSQHMSPGAAFGRDPGRGGVQALACHAQCSLKAGLQNVLFWFAEYLGVLLGCLGLVLLCAQSLGASDDFTAAERNHWAFRPVRRPEIPQGKDAGQNPIDAFISSSLITNELHLSPSADQATLLRRATLDLTGLPPTPEEAMLFLSDSTS